MKRTIYLTESDIHNMVLEAISELANNDYITEGKLKDAGLFLATLAGIGAGGSALQNMHSDVTYPQSVFYDVEQKKAKEVAQNPINYADYMEQQYTNAGKNRVERLTGKQMPNNAQVHTKKEQIQAQRKARKIMRTAKNLGYYPSQELMDYIKSYETLHQGWQDDGYGNPTTGWGTKQTPELLQKYPNGVHTPEEADKLLYEYIQGSLEEFIAATPNIKMLPQRVKDALYDLRYNIGINKYRNSSHLMAALSAYSRTKNLTPIINNLRFAKANGKPSKGLSRRSDDRKDMAVNGNYDRDF